MFNEFKYPIKVFWTFYKVFHDYLNDEGIAKNVQEIEIPQWSFELPAS